MTDDIDIKRDTRPNGSKELVAVMMMALNGAKREAQRASNAGVDASIERMPMRCGNGAVMAHVMVVRHG